MLSAAPIPTGRILLNGLAGNDILLVSLPQSIPAWLFGGDRNDVLLGSRGNDVLFGQAGDDLLIGGTGADALFGGNGADLLLGAATAFDANQSALALLLAEWTGPRNYLERVANLQGVGSIFSPKKTTMVRLGFIVPEAVSNTDTPWITSARSAARAAGQARSRSATSPPPPTRILFVALACYRRLLSLLSRTSVCPSKNEEVLILIVH